MDCIVKFGNQELKESFEELKNKDSELYNQLLKAREDICKNAFCGRNVRKKLIPKSFVKKYNINNLWIYNLRDAWRLLYTITSPDKIELMAVVLDWMDHKDYERLFGF
jgi:hypothetical protein